MAITGVHTILYTSEASALRHLIRIAFGWDFVDSGDGWLIFATPPGEMAVHPAGAPAHEVSLMCDDLDGTVADLEANGIEFVGDPQEHDWGRSKTMVLPGDVRMLLYEPKHESPPRS